MGRVSRFRNIFGINELSVFSPLWKALLAEYIGTALLVLIGCGSCIGDWTRDYKPTVVQIALAFGLAVGCIVHAIGHVSGGHINPAVTMAMMLTGKCSVIRSVFYIICQCLGAVTGAGLLKALTPTAQNEVLGTTLVNSNLTPVQAWGVEFLITFALVLTVFSVCDANRRDATGSPALTIGLIVVTSHLFAVNYTGSSMNCARSLGPAVFSGMWKDHWVYWIGPLSGGIVGGLLYDAVFSTFPPSLPKSEGVEACSSKICTDEDEKEVIADRTTTI
ncbi:aquaporin AQPAe.a-like [Centruroides sculpturatus]|uniref:aquaporin AQPAe.a-like n=1 Tax=Centruroides sculpturatus TaxID=218467 RepID=UPI000C6D06FC|nr:aquaporin AQPAe.a-like [Centruroides sculpturatus]